MSWPIDPLPDCRLATDGVHLGQDHVQALDGAHSSAFTTSVRLGVSVVFQLVAILQLGTDGELAVDVDHRIAKDADAVVSERP